MLLSVQIGESEGETVTKKELYEIAKANVSSMLQSGTIQQIKSMSIAEIAQIRSGGKSVDELVEHCRNLAEKQAKRDEERGRKADDSDSDSSRSDEPRRRHSSEEKDFTFRHPFAVKPAAAITMNISNATSVPIKTPQERARDELTLRLSFPVSSGQQHRATEGVITSDWVPVEEPLKAITSAKDVPALPAPPPLPPVSDLGKTVPASAQAEAEESVEETGVAPLPPPPEPPASSLSDVVNQRLRAIRALQADPNDVEALKLMHNTEELMKNWAESKNVPGAFHGSTGVHDQLLTPAALGPSSRKYQAVAKRDTLTSTEPLETKIGKALLEKMGWKAGEGLGKNKSGSLMPLLLDVKIDRKGLSAVDESRKMRAATMGKSLKEAMQAIQNKHPVSTLMELCSKKRWTAPNFTCEETGNANGRRYLWTVDVNGVSYAPSTSVNNKKLGKVQAAVVALQSMGVIPRDNSLPVVIG